MDSGVGSSDQQFLHGFRSSDGFLNQGEMQGDRLHRAAILVQFYTSDASNSYGALERIYLAWGILKADRLDYNPGGTGAVVLLIYPHLDDNFIANLALHQLIESDLEAGFWDLTSVLFPFIAVKMEHHFSNYGVESHCQTEVSFVGQPGRGGLKGSRYVVPIDLEPLYG
ncbi:hypothetical protein NC653_005494 [Populus alba x Populus x berolinensis]|uniref:Uncharacterized protein n=1 Tax=Populus alba x Populus x berolinensis TaxID=444605 RepID=A0AAD6RCB5_9ROSI|nr:hypothetical protein NC653_005494 [Populus alba x Populus x berolinensis]